MSPHHGREIDPVTGYDTTGHDWNGIKELNTPFPKVVIWALVLSFLYSVLAWVLLPAWPVGQDYTRGLLGLDQGEEAIKGFRKLSDERNGWLDRFATGDFAALNADAALIRQAMPTARRLFEDNCAGCHGSKGQGGPGFPALANETWLWSGDPEQLALTIRHGINSSDPDTRIAEMPTFDWMERSDRIVLSGYVATLPESNGDTGGPAATLFAENCAACHGESGQGGLGVGAPALADQSVIYGQDESAVMETLRHGRRGVMPAWSRRLSNAEINLLALYVARLGNKRGAK